MDHYRVYLRAELGKLCNLGDAQTFLAHMPEAVLDRIRIADTPGALTAQFADQGLVDAFVQGLSDSDLVELTRHCDTWRNNGVSRHLSPNQHIEFVTASIENVLLRPAESFLRDRFEQLGWSLPAIARDPEVLQSHPYVGEIPGQPVAFATCLAELRGQNYTVIDGMHRAIQLVRNGETQIHLCVVVERGAA
jgi:hypothetical protein